MKEDLMRMTAILQTDVPEEKPFQPDLPREGRIDDEEPFKIVEKVKEDLVKVSERVVGGEGTLPWRQRREGAPRMTSRIPVTSRP